MCLSRVMLLTTIALLFCGISNAQQRTAEQSTAKDVQTLFNTYTRGNSAERRAAKAEIVRQSSSSAEFRQQAIDQLSALLDDPKAANSGRSASADLLGQLHATEAIPVLVKHITLTTGVSGLSLHTMPAAAALADIGKPAIASALPLLEDPNPRIRIASARVLASIGDASALPALEKALKVEHDQHAKFFVAQAIKVLSERN